MPSAARDVLKFAYVVMFFFYRFFRLLIMVVVCLVLWERPVRCCFDEQADAWIFVGIDEAFPSPFRLARLFRSPVASIKVQQYVAATSAP